VTELTWRGAEKEVVAFCIGVDQEGVASAEAVFTLIRRAQTAVMRVYAEHEDRGCSGEWVSGSSENRVHTGNCTQRVTWWHPEDVHSYCDFHMTLSAGYLHRTETAGSFADAIEAGDVEV
jgi:hypothetical protein